MFQGHRMVLESGVQVGLGQVTGVARFGKQHDVGQSQPGDEFRSALQRWFVRGLINTDK